MTANEVCPGIDTQWVQAVVNAHKAAHEARNMDMDYLQIYTVAYNAAMQELQGRDSAEASADWIAVRVVNITRHG